MNNVRQLFPEQAQENTNEAIQEQACLWISKMDRSLTTAEKNEFISWAQQNKLHQEILFKFAALWDDLSVLNELSALFPLEKQKTKRILKNRFAKYAIAASFIIAVLFTGSLYLEQRLNARTVKQQYVEIKSLSTVVGQQSSFSLSDGSILQLNTNSLVKINFSRNKRLLTLVRGEARFEVAKDKTRPFTVVSGTKSFTALGTIFNVQKNSNRDMELVVTEGRVLITKTNQLLDSSMAKQIYSLPADKLPGVLVISGEKAVIEKNIEEPVQKVSLDQVQKDLAWQQGMLIFEGEPLKAALKEVSRYTATHFEIVDSELANIKVAGYFKAGDIDGLLKSLSSNFNIYYEKTNKNSIRLSKAPNKALQHFDI
ncbi:MAG: FecR domain-containing protein [Alteromonadaceae bacterium]|nr:FecR domain-containing protein [Alteromonadaceae bacterium]